MLTKFGQPGFHDCPFADHRRACRLPLLDLRMNSTFTPVKVPPELALFLLGRIVVKVLLKSHAAAPRGRKKVPTHRFEFSFDRLTERTGQGAIRGLKSTFERQGIEPLFESHSRAVKGANSAPRYIAAVAGCSLHRTPEIDPCRAMPWLPISKRQPHVGIPPDAPVHCGTHLVDTCAAGPVGLERNNSRERHGMSERFGRYRKAQEGSCSMADGDASQRVVARRNARLCQSPAHRV